MSLATPDANTGEFMSQLPARGTAPRPTRRHSLDLVGASALLLAIVGLAGTLFLFRTPSALQAADAPPALSATVRDQWYLDAPATQSGARVSSPAKDRWYQDTPAGGATPASVPAVRDRSLLGAPPPANATSVSTQARDRWYLEEQDTP